MTPDAIAQAAARNRANRLAQIERLTPMRADARAKAEAFRSAQTGARTAQETLDLMRTLSHVPGFFPTPREVIARMIERAGLRAGETVLEPSAGKGDLIKSALACGAVVQGYELNHTLAEYCRKQGYSVTSGDFLTVEPLPMFDVVLMNPPFERRADEKHIRHAARFLRPDGRLIAVACSTTGSRLAFEFDVELLPAGSFSKADRCTNVNTCLVVKQ